MVLMEALKNFSVMMLHSIPLLTIISSFIYFSMNASPDKRFLLTMTPIIALLNTFLLFIFFFVKIDFMPLSTPSSLFAYPEVKEGYINPIGDYKILLFPESSKLSRKGIMFYKNAYFIQDISAKKGDVNLTSGEQINDSSITKQWASFSIPKKEQVIQLPYTGVSSFMLDTYINYIKKH